MRYLFCLLLLLNASMHNVILADPSPAEQLLAALKAAEEDTEKFQLYLQLASHYQGTQTELSINYSLMAYNLAQQNQWSAQAFDALAIGVESMLNNEQLHEGGFRLLQLLRNMSGAQLSVEQRINREAIEARLLLRFGDAEAASGHLEAAETLLAEMEAPLSHIQILTLRGDFNLNNQDTLSAIGMYKQAIDLLPQSDISDFHKTQLYLKIAGSYLALEDPEQCIFYCNQLLSWLENEQSPSRLNTDFLLAKSYAQLDLYKIFEERSLELMTRARKASNVNIQGELYLLLTKYENNLSRQPKGQDYYSLALKFSRHEGLLFLQKEILLTKKKNLLAAGKRKAASWLTPMIADLHQELLENQQSEKAQIAQLQLTLANKKIVNEGQTAQLKTVQKSLRDQKRSGYINYLLLLVIVACVGGLLLFLHQTISSKGQLETSLTERTAELKNTRHRLRDTEVRLASNEAELQRVLRLSVEEIKVPVKNMEQLLNGGVPFSRPALNGHLSQVDFLLDEMEEYNRLRRESSASSHISLQESVMQVLENLKSEIEKMDMVIEVEELPLVVGNETHMVQLFQNLIYDVMALPGSDATIRIEHHETADQHFFSIKNATAIIGEQMKNAIDDLFNNYPAGQFHPIAGRALTIVKKIIAEYKGKIWLESKPDRGSVFHFTLPKERDYSIKPI